MTRNTALGLSPGPHASRLILREVHLSAPALGRCLLPRVRAAPPRHQPLSDRWALVPSLIPGRGSDWHMGVGCPLRSNQLSFVHLPAGELDPLLRKMNIDEIFAHNFRRLTDPLRHNGEPGTPGGESLVGRVLWLYLFYPRRK